MNPSETVLTGRKGTAAVTAAFALMAALIAGCGTYIYQHTQQEKSLTALQTQIDALNNQSTPIASSAKATTLPAESAAPRAAVPNADCGPGYGPGVSDSEAITTAALDLTKQWLDQYVGPAAGAACRLASYQVVSAGPLTALAAPGTYSFGAKFDVTTSSASMAFWSAGNGQLSGNSLKGKSMFFKVTKENGLYRITQGGTSPTYQ